jgi:hypothetical protein
MKSYLNGKWTLDRQKYLFEAEFQKQWTVKEEKTIARLSRKTTLGGLWRTIQAGKRHVMGLMCLFIKKRRACLLVVFGVFI